VSDHRSVMENQLNVIKWWIQS